VAYGVGTVLISCTTGPAKDVTRPLSFAPGNRELGPSCRVLYSESHTEPRRNQGEKAVYLETSKDPEGRRTLGRTYRGQTRQFKEAENELGSLC